MDVANEIPLWTLRVLPCHAPRTPWGWFPWRPQGCAELGRTCWLADAGRVREDEGGGQGHRSRVTAHGTNLKTFLLRVGSVMSVSRTRTPTSSALLPPARAERLQQGARLRSASLGSPLTPLLRLGSSLSSSLKPASPDHSWSHSAAPHD